MSRIVIIKLIYNRYKPIDPIYATALTCHKLQ
jgi:hypothetical protein